MEGDDKYLISIYDIENKRLKEVLIGELRNN